ncbi:MAG: hypothetical protein JXB49_20030 [Bacteroidales bacterium]|nr:hypothetical protein [Bacteroidales bacterium]
MIRKIWILIFTAIPLLSMGQKTISDWIELNDLKHPEFKAINLFVQKEDKKILVEKIELNNKCLILRKAEYCNFLYEPLDSIEREIYEYDNSDTLLISRRFENENGDTLRLFKYNYEYDSIGRLLCKGIEDVTFNEYEIEQYFYNEFGLINKLRINFYNETRDSISYFIDWDFSYDKFGNRVKESFVPEGVAEFERIYEFDSLNNLTSYETEGIHQCGYDIDRYRIEYNSDSQKILKEIWNASGDNWAYDYVYDQSGKLIKEVKKSRYLKRKYRKNKGSEFPPPPQMINKNMLEPKYTDEYDYKFFYDSKARLIRVSETFLKYNLKTDYLIEYE